jgi:hypothetical protein
MQGENDDPNSEKSARDHNFSCLKMAIPMPNGTAESKENEVEGKLVNNMCLAKTQIFIKINVQ